MVINKKDKVKTKRDSTCSKRSNGPKAPKPLCLLKNLKKKKKVYYICV